MQSKKLKPSVFIGLTTALILLAIGVAAQTPARIAEPIDATKTVTLPGNVHPLAQPQYDRGMAPSSLPMQRMLLTLQRSPEQEKSLQLFVASQHDPKSPNFHKWLSPDQFGKRFGAAQSDLDQIVGWLQLSGFQVGKISRGRTVIEFSGTASQVQQAFRTSIHQYEVRGQQHWANSSSPEVPAALSGIVAGVASLNNFFKRPTSHVMGRGKFVNEGGESKLVPINPDATFNGSNFIAPGDFWTIYNATPLISDTNPIDGAGQTIAIVGRSDILADDITGFRSVLLPAPYSGTTPFNQINNGPDPGSVDGDNIENTLDVEWSSALAPAATIDLVVSASTATTDGVDLSAEYIVDNNLAPVMSSSYSLCEAYLGTTENQFLSNLWEQAAAQGITSMVAAGDNGAAGCDDQNASGDPNNPSVARNGLQVNGLSSTPYNVSVGGNELTNDSSAYWGPNRKKPGPYTSALSYIPEAVWNESCSPTNSACGGPASASLWSGSGGASGCLNPTFDQNGNLTECQGAYAKPSWQAGVFGIPNDGVRDLPDVAFTAAGHDGYIVCFNESCQGGGFYSVGGTSASSPAFTGVMALVNQKTNSRQGQANYILYQLAANEYGSTALPNKQELAACNSSRGNAIGASCIFVDVTKGNNEVPCAAGSLNCSATKPGSFGKLTAYKASAGYDQTTGLGALNIANLVNSWSTVTQTGTATTLTLGATRSVYGQPVNIAGSVTSTSGNGTPTGSVSILTSSGTPDDQGIGALQLANGTFNGPIGTLPGGSYSVFARYSGDGVYSSSTSTGVNINVSPTSSAAALTYTATDPVTKAVVPSSAAPYGSNIAANATIQGVTGLAIPTGSVQFQQAATVLDTAVVDLSGNATFSSGGYALGTYSWRAAYSGDNNYKPSTSGSSSFRIVRAQTNVKLRTSATFVSGSGSGTATLTATVADDSFLTNPTGTLTFYVGSKRLGSVAVQAATDPYNGTSIGSATFQVTAAMLALGSNSLTASYGGDPNYSSSKSSAITIGYSSVAPRNAIALIASPNVVQTKQKVTLTATVVTNNIPATAGTVNFLDGKTPIGSAQIVGNSPANGAVTGTAVLTCIFAPGIHSVTAVYTGIAAAPVIATTNTLVQVTGTLPSQIELTAQPDGQNPNNYDFAATAQFSGLAKPTAPVDFFDLTAVVDLGSTAFAPSTVRHGFGAAKVENASGSPTLSVVADFNGDGIPDLATPNAVFGPSTLAVFLGKGDGTFESPVSYPAGYFASGLVAGDFNNDGIIDLLVMNQDTTVDVYLGKGDGTFQPALVVNGIGELPVAIVAGDYNHDGFLDFATVDYFANSVLISLGNGDGTFQPAVSYAVGNSPYSLASADFNGDGNADLAIINNGDDTVGVLLGNSDGTFQTQQVYPIGFYPEFVTAGDLNLDGKPDMVVSNYGEKTIGILIGNGDGTFQPQVAYHISGNGSSVAIGDLNGDGKPDLAVSLFHPEKVEVLAGKGDGTFESTSAYKTGQSQGYGITIADLNGDGALDMISSDLNASISIFLNETLATATLKNVTVPGSSGQQQNVVAKYPGDSNYSDSKSKPVIVSAH
ncbi:MAG TPA: FG-GAP-like repeat-containing protein [Terriglobales bacterium]|nr:FG-GAP-like repeat-containing protein [Terriglobales bacterium]